VGGLSASERQALERWYWGPGELSDDASLTTLYDAVEAIIAARLAVVEALADAWDDPGWSGRSHSAAYVRALRAALTTAAASDERAGTGAAGSAGS
jgi:hypothetical protein